MRRNREMFSIDVLALALLTCLLASVVGMLVMAEDGRSVKRRAAIHQDTLRLREFAADSRNALVGIGREVELLRLERERRVLETDESVLARNIEARRKIVAAENETGRLRDELKKREDEMKKRREELAGREGRINIAGDYKGEFVVIECVNKGAFVYPGKTKISSRPDKRTMARLMDQIDQAGFVVFVVRPEGWYQNSFHALEPAISAEIDNLKAKGGKSIGRCTYPLEAKIPIEACMPRGPKNPDPAKPTPAQGG